MMKFSTNTITYFRVNDLYSFSGKDILSTKDLLDVDYLDRLLAERTTLDHNHHGRMTIPKLSQTFLAEYADLFVHSAMRNWSLYSRSAIILSRSSSHSIYSTSPPEDHAFGMI